MKKENIYFRSRSYKEYIKNTLLPGMAVAIIDAETVGLDKYDEIIQFAAEKVVVQPDYSLKVVSDFNTYIRPTEPVSPKITKLTGISNDFLSNKRPEEVEFSFIDDFIKDVAGIAGHNVNFDIYKLMGMYFRQGHVSLPKTYQIYDTLEMSRDFDHKNSHKLSDVAKEYGLDTDITFHNAMDDVKATKRIMEYFVKSYDNIVPWEGTVKPKIETISYYEMPSHKENRIYNNTDCGTVYFNVYYRIWGAKNDTDITILDMEYIQDEAVKMLGMNSIEEFSKYKGSYIHQKGMKNV